MNKKVLITILVIVLCLLSIIGAIVIYNKANITLEKFSLENNSYGKTDFIRVNSREINELIDDKKSVVIFTYNNFCTMQIPCEKIFEEYMEKNKVGIYSIEFDDFKNTYLYKKIKYAPSVIIVRDGEVVDYLDAEDDKDLDKYQNVDEFSKWINKYIIK